MASDNDIWREYAARVKRVGKKKTKAVFDRAESASQPASSPPLRGSIIFEAGAASAKMDPRQGAGMTRFSLTRKCPGLCAPTIFDRRVERQLRRGAIRIDAKLDLHGMTQSLAHEALAHFMAQHVKQGSRKLLIVTGKGRGNAGVLKTSLRGWLSDLPQADRIIDLRPAATKHGGDGAFYVWLKKGSGFRG